MTYEIFLLFLYLPYDIIRLPFVMLLHAMMIRAPLLAISLAVSNPKAEFIMNGRRI